MVASALVVFNFVDNATVDRFRMLEMTRFNLPQSEVMPLGEVVISPTLYNGIVARMGRELSAGTAKILTRDGGVVHE